MNATAEWHAGVPPVCRAAVRLLDRVHFSVRPGDCVVVQHRDPSGATVLLAALHGHAALTTGAHFKGERHVGTGVRIRRCRISPEAMEAVQQGWSRAASGPFTGVTSTGVSARPVVYLLRAARAGRVADFARQQWQHWAQRVRTEGGALVLVTPAGIADAPAAPEVVHRALHEPEPGAYRRSATATRYVRLHHGRLFALRQWD